MAVVYFTSNASTGAGSLREAIQNARPGDVVRPDETVFERGATIEIALAGPLNVDKNLTLDASPFRVVLDGGGAVRCVSVVNGANATFTAFDFIAGKAASGGGLYSTGDGSATLNRCGVYGCQATYGGGIAFETNGALRDCVVAGCQATGTGGAIMSSGDLTVDGSTIYGCVASEGAPGVRAKKTIAATNSLISGVSAANGPTYVGCVVGVAPSAIGFVAPPPDDLNAENWNANLWRDWDLRLLDDASPNPSPYRDAGVVDKRSQYDLRGAFRGRVLDGVTTRSPGAFETIRADLFWIGKDANGAEVAAPSFLTSDGWAPSRFATAAGDVAPQGNATLFIDGDVEFVDALSTHANACNIVVGGAANVSALASAQARVLSLQVGLGSTFNVYAIASKPSRFGAWSRLANFFSTSAECDFDVDAYASHARLSTGLVSPTADYGKLELEPKKDLTLEINGVYNCREFNVIHRNNLGSRLAIKVGAATIRANKIGFTPGSDRAEKLFERSVTFALQGAANATVPNDAPSTWSADFAVAVDDVVSANLTLNGQIVYGDAPNAAITLIGAAKIDARDLTSQSLTLNDDATLTLADATLRTRVLATAAGSRLDGKGRVEFASNATWTNDGATLNGVAAPEYDAASNDVKIVVDFDASEIRNAFNDGVCRWSSEALDAGTTSFVFEKYQLDAQGQGEYQTIYNTSQPIYDASSPVYETAFDWNGETLKTVVHATPEPGWNYYRVQTPEFINIGGAKIYHGGQTTRYFVFWNADGEPEITYHYRGGANGSYASTSDWALTADGVAKFEGAPKSAGAVFVVGRSARLRDFPADSLQTSVVFPSVVDVYNASGVRLSDREARLVSVGVPTPDALEFYVGKGGTSGFWTHCDGATLYRVEAVDGSASGSADSNRWLATEETQAKSWRARVAAPVYGGVENWSTQTAAVQPFKSLVETASYDDATLGNAFELVYSDDFDGVCDATIERTRKSDGTSTILSQRFSGGEFIDVPETFDEYVYRVSWTKSPENVWLETTAAPWFVADGFDATTQTNFITTPCRAYETPTFAARIEKKSNGEPLKRQEVAKISYSLFETRDHWTTRAERLAVGPDGSYWRHDVEIPAATVRDSLLVDPNFWSRDEIGANFVFSPDDGRPFFPGPGSYLVRATLETTNQRRIVVEFPTQVE